MDKNSSVTNERCPSGETPCSSCAVRSAGACGEISEDQFPPENEVRRGFRHIRAKQLIQRAGDRPSEVFTVYTGWAFRFMLLPDGRRQILTFYLPGDLIGVHTLLGPTTARSSAEAITDLKLCVLDGASLRSAIFANANSVQKYEELRMERVFSMDELILDLGRRSADERVVRLILEFYARQKARNAVKDLSFEFPLRQKHLADTLGLATTYVGKILAWLLEQKLISRRGNLLRILDLEQLVELAALDKMQRDSLLAEV